VHSVHLSAAQAVHRFSPHDGRGAEAIFTVRTWGDASPPCGHGLVRNFSDHYNRCAGQRPAEV